MANIICNGQRSTLQLVIKQYVMVHINNVVRFFLARIPTSRQQYTCYDINLICIITDRCNRTAYLTTNDSTNVRSTVCQVYGRWSANVISCTVHQQPRRHSFHWRWWRRLHSWQILIGYLWPLWAIKLRWYQMAGSLSRLWLLLSHISVAPSHPHMLHSLARLHCYTVVV